MYRKGYRLLFWGFLFTFLNFKVGDFDLFADVLGYILISAGLQRLVAQHERYQRALPWSLILIVFGAVLPVGTIVTEGASYASFVANLLLLLGQASEICELLMIYHICMAFMSLARQRNFTQLHDAVQFRWKAYFAFSTAILFLMPFTLTNVKIVTIPLSVLALTNFFAFFMIILVVSAAAKELAEG